MRKEGIFMNDSAGQDKRRFDFGDIVRIDECEDELYRVEGYTELIYYSSEGMYQESYYDLARIPDGLYLDGYDDNMTLICTAEEAWELLEKRKAKNRQSTLSINSKKSPQEQIDDLLDEHNDFMELYRITRDKEYIELAKLAFDFIKELQQKELKFEIPHI